MGQKDNDKRRITLNLSEDLLNWIDGLKSQLGLRSRGDMVERLLRELQDSRDEDGDSDLGGGERSEQQTAASIPDDQTAIVLIHSALVQRGDLERDAGQTAESGRVFVSGRDQKMRAAPRGEAGIQLPGFVRRQASELKRSLSAPARAADPAQVIALIAPEQLSDALERARQHWNEVYGQSAHEPVLEAAMVWLARDIWPQSDQSEGRPFSWSLAQQVVSSMAPSWEEGEASLERVITIAGILEDPFSGTTLSLRIPTLITRFVQRQRRRQKRGTSFDAFDQAMTVHAALKLLQLSTVADRPYTLREIREAYRDQALNHHPDAGGSPEAMRRLNEAYQFLKDRYRDAA